MNPNKALWEKGDFTRIAASMRDSGEALVKDLGISEGSTYLDLGMRRWNDGIAGGEARGECPGCRHREGTSSRPETACYRARA